MSTNPVATREPDAASVPAFSMTPRSFDEAMKFAELMSKSDLVPKDFKDKPGNILVAIQKGQEVGLSPMAALETIAVINGRASLWGDGLLGIVQGSPVYEWIDESQCSERSGVCTVKRKGEQPYTATFSLDDAKRAGLLGKPGPWTQYTKRMLQLRARGFALRDKFSDVLKGMIAAEEALDTVTILPAVSDEPKPDSLKERLRAQAQIEESHDKPAADGPVSEAVTLPTEGTQQGGNTPQAPSAAEFCKQRAAEADQQYEDGFIGNIAPYQGTKSYQKGVKPGYFDVEDGQGTILRKFKYMDPDLDVSSGLKRVYYRTEVYQGKTSFAVTKVDPLE